MLLSGGAATRRERSGGPCRVRTRLCLAGCASGPGGSGRGIAAVRSSKKKKKPSRCFSRCVLLLVKTAAEPPSWPPPQVAGPPASAGSLAVGPARTPPRLHRVRRLRTQLPVGGAGRSAGADRALPLATCGPGLWSICPSSARQPLGVPTVLSSRPGLRSRVSGEPSFHRGSA